MDEHRFWSSALGEWIGDCLCGPSSLSQSGQIVAEMNWRSPSNLELQLRYAELCDGIALNLLFSFLNNEHPLMPRAFLFQQNPQPEQSTSVANVERSESLSSGVSSNSVPISGAQSLPFKLRQFHQLLAALCRFYRDKSLLVLSLPDVLCIARSPLPELSGHEMHKLLALLLGAAVHSQQREHFIERIKKMRPEVQSELAEEIQRVTSGNENSPVVNLDSLLAELENGRNGEEENGRGEEGNNGQRRIVALIERAIRERDELANGLLEMAQDLDQDDTGPSSGLTTASSSCNGDIPPAKCPNGGGGRSPSPNAIDRHNSVELAAAKAELRKLRNENEEKEEMLMEVQDELEKARAEIGRLQGERLELVKDARAAKDYKDEMDCLQHKLNRLERLEAENEKMRGRLGELDFYKSRVNHLKEDNKIMQETYRVMEEQLEQYQRKMTAQMEVEAKLGEAQANIKSLQMDLTKTRERVEELLVENGRLERELRGSRQKNSELEREMNCLSEFASPRASLEGANGSLNESSLLAQLEAHNQSQILELQLENRKLKAKLENDKRMDLFEMKSELAAKEELAQERAEKCEKLAKELEETKKMAEENEEKMQKLQFDGMELETQLAEMKRTTVALKTHQTIMEQMEGIEQKSQELELNARVERERTEMVEAEKGEMEIQLQKMCSQQRENRLEKDALREQIKMEQDKFEKQRKMWEQEKMTLKGQLEMVEGKNGEVAVAKRNADNLARKLAELERELAEREAKIGRMEEELGVARQEQDGHIRRAQMFREELAAEKDRLRDLLARLRSVCLMAIRTGNEEGEGKCCLEMEDDIQLISIIDDLLMEALCSARREADALRIQQQKQIRELDDLKRDIVNLRRTGHELNASDDKLLVENRNIKEQVNLLQERLHRAQTEECTRAAELQAAKREIDELQQKAFAHSRQSAELANLQMALRNGRKNEEQLRQELASTKAQLELALKGHAETQKRLDSLELIHSALASDHDRLQNLHQMLSSDYDRVKREKEAIRQKLRGEKKLDEAFEAQRVEKQREAKRIGELENELQNAQQELATLKREQNSNRSEDYSADELRRLRMAECAQKSTINNLNAIIQQLNNALIEKELELANLRRQVEMLRQYNGDENKTLIRQIELLLIQNQQLHNRSDVFYAEQKELQEKLLNLRRHKEKLEEKIMEQYKAMDSRKLERTTFMKRAAKALIAKSPSRKSRHGKEGNSASDKSEESSIYSTENELMMVNGGGNGTGSPSIQQSRMAADGNGAFVNTAPPQSSSIHSQTPKSPTMPKDRPQPQSTESAHQPFAQHLAPPASRNASSLCSSSIYSSISHYQQNSIDRDQPHPNSLSPLIRARNGRLGGSLRYPPTNPMMARSFPAPAWRKPSREYPPQIDETPPNQLPACCKVMQADILPENGEQCGETMPRPNNGVQQNHQRQISLPPTGLPPKVPSQQSIHRPPPPPYPGGKFAPGKMPFPPRGSSSPSFGRQNAQIGLVPRDSSTPNSSKHLPISSSTALLPSPIAFPHANNGEMEDEKPKAHGFKENLEIVERPERAPSVYENVAAAEKNGEEGGKGKMNEELNGERRGEKGEIWYELGCV